MKCLRKECLCGERNELGERMREMFKNIWMIFKVKESTLYLFGVVELDFLQGNTNSYWVTCIDKVEL